MKRERAHIHHIDGNPLNNPLNGSNWEVLCPKCHRVCRADHSKAKIADGIYIQVHFSYKKATEILDKANWKCQRCGVPLNLVNFNKTYTCDWCHNRCSEKGSYRWDGTNQVMCRECFEEWDRAGRPVPEYWSPSKEFVAAR